MANNVTVQNGRAGKVVTIEFDENKTIITTDKSSGEVDIKDFGTAPPSQTCATDDLELKFKPKLEYGGKISDILFPVGEEMVLFTNSPGCYWYWNRRQWIWRCTQ